MANFKAILLSDRREFVMKEHKNDKWLCGAVTEREKRSREKIVFDEGK